MPKLHYNGQTFILEEGDTAIDFRGRMQDAFDLAQSTNERFVTVGVTLQVGAIMTVVVGEGIPLAFEDDYDGPTSMVY
jgi:hypothetical protein